MSASQVSKALLMRLMYLGFLMLFVEVMAWSKEHILAAADGNYTSQQHRLPDKIGSRLQKQTIPRSTSSLRPSVFTAPGTNKTQSVGKLNPLGGSCDMQLSDAASCRSGQAYVKTRQTNRPQCRLQELLRNCSEFRLSRGYDIKPVTQEEEDFPLAFAIRMHTAPEQVEQLLRTIYRPHNVYCVHVDNKAPPNVFHTMQALGRCLGNVIVLEERIDVIYASIRLVQSELLCMRQLVLSPVPWRYYLNMAGQEFPIKTNSEMVMVLKIFNGTNDIETFDHPRHQEWRYRYHHVFTKEGQLERTNLTKSPFPRALTISKGSAYGAFTRSFVRFILEDDIAHEFISWLSDAYAPEEIVWATLNTLPWAPGGYMQEVRHSLGTHASRAVVWSWDRTPCHGHFVRSVCIFSAADIPWLLRQPQLVANKFEAALDSSVIDCLEAELHDRTYYLHTSDLDWAYFKNLPHVTYYTGITDGEKSVQHLLKLKEEWILTH